GEFAGLDQVNLRLSASLAGRGEVDIVLTVDGKTANVVRVNIGGTAVQPPPSTDLLPLATGMTWGYRVTFPSNVQLPYQPVFEREGLLCTSIHCGFVNWNAGTINFQITAGARFDDPTGGDSYRLTSTGQGNEFFFGNRQDSIEMRVRDRSGARQLEIVGFLAFRNYRPLARLLPSDTANTQTLTVPAGTYQNVVRTIVTLNGGASVGNNTWTTELFLAPGVGIIRAIMRDSGGRELYTMDLTSFSATSSPPPGSFVFTLSNLRVTPAANNVILSMDVDFNDTSGSACTDRVRWKVRINNTIDREEPSASPGNCPNGTQGSLFQQFNVFNAGLPTGVDIPVRVVITNARGTESNEVSTTFRIAPPPPPVPRLTSVNPLLDRAGQTIATFTLTGQDLASVTAVEFSPATGITVSSVQATATSVTAQIVIAAGAKVGVRALTVNGPGGRSNVLPFYVAAAVPPPPGRPEIHFVSRRTFRPGEMISDFTVFGANLGGVTSISFSSGANITVSNLRATDNMVTATLNVVSGTSALFYTFELVSPSGRSTAAYLFDILSGPTGTFRISNLRIGTVTSTSSQTRIPITFDYEDSTTAATGGNIQINYSIERATLFGLALQRPTSVTGSAARGTMTLVITTSNRLVSGQTLLLDFTANNTRGLESNFLAGEFRSP
ncbi:MAG: hypothetical protein ACRD44_00470, partial [Bryobacteraceae bacterium]